MFRLVRKYTKQFTLAALLAPCLVILEVILEQSIPKVMTEIIDKGINGPNGSDLALISTLGKKMVILSVAAMFVGAASGILSAFASSGFIHNIREALYRQTQMFSFKNMDKFEVPSLVTRMTKDMREFRMAYMSIIRMLVRSPMQLITATFMVFTINSDLGKVFLVALPILGTGLFLISHYAHPRFRVLMRKFDKMNGALEENFVAIRVVKTFVREQFEKIKFDRTSQDVLKQQRFAESLVLLNSPLFNLVMYACMIAVAWFGGNHIIAGDMTTGEFMSFLSYLRSILFGLMMLSMALMQIIFAQAAVDRANEILDEEIDITDNGNDPDLIPEDGSVIFNHVSFKYTEEARKNALTDIDLTIRSGETVGIIGSTGSGKTTLVQLLPRLYDVTEGEVLVGGHDVREYKLENLRKDVAMVLQKNVLFSGTIEENLKWGNLNATHEEVEEAAKCAQAHDFITSFPKGYQTDLGQGGVNVSGGQKQRLCIARALLKKPKIIILDDSTSAVDTDTDKRIRKALKERLAGMTTIIIAQRVASVMDADKIIVMKDGMIRDIGTHEQLLNVNEEYHDLYVTQMQGVSE